MARTAAPPLVYCVLRVQNSTVCRKVIRNNEVPAVAASDTMALPTLWSSEVKCAAANQWNGKTRAA